MTPDPSRPAVLGGEPTRPAGPPDWPIDDDVRVALDAAARDGSWGRYHGPHVERLETELARLHGVEFALCCSSGTLAVELSLRAVRVGPGDEVILASYDYGGNILSVLAVGAQPVLVDVDAGNWNLAPGAVEAAVSPRTKAIIASHLHGGVVPIGEIVTLARSHGVAVIEDAAQMPGAWIDGRRAGGWGDVGILSFGGSKLLSAGRGGAIVTADRSRHHRAKLLCQRGNNLLYPLSEIQAAVLAPQLAKLDDRNRLRAENVRRLTSGLDRMAGLRPLRNSVLAAEPGYYKVGFQYDPAAFSGLARDRFVAAMRAEGIAIDAGFRAAHVGRARSRFRRSSDLAESDRAHHGMVVLHHPILLGSPTDIDQIIAAVRKVQQHGAELAAASQPPDAEPSQGDAAADTRGN
jgi:dTDP-4-amino-4,6-dideoxygalactose transaminase